jgi:multiple sugar transport system substrate-binding protein
MALMPFRLAAAGLLFFLAGCSSLTPTLVQSPTPTETAPASTPVVTAAPPPSPTPERPQVLRLWVPPQFDPAGSSEAGQVLQARLREFQALQPEVLLEVRVKALEGPGGMLDTLTTASAAAPAALPDLVAVPRHLLEAAALKGLLYAYDPQQTSLNQADWYLYAQEMARLQDSVFGLPFAGDILTLVYRAEEIEQPPASWEDALALEAVLAYAAADPQALFTLAQYQALNGAVRDDQGRPILQVDPLARVLRFYQQAEASGLMPVSLTQYQTQEQAWAAFDEGLASLVVVWSSIYLSHPGEGASLAPMPTYDAEPFTLAQGWLWSLAAPESQRHPLAVDLAEFLTDSQFIARLSAAAGYLPTRPSALPYWPAPAERTVIGRLLVSAALAPASDVINSLGMPLETATTQVLKKQSEPLAAAQTAAGALRGP